VSSPTEKLYSSKLLELKSLEELLPASLVGSLAHQFVHIGGAGIVAAVFLFAAKRSPKAMKQARARSAG
jgi:hypothetical protein